jgi:hypothetical protein
MESFAALGIAANIAQFIDYGIKLTSTASEIYRSPSGTTKENVLLGDIMADLEVISSRLINQSENGHPSIQLSKEQCAMRQLAQHCHRISGELQQILSDLSIADNTQLSRTKAILQVFRHRNKRGKVEELYQALVKARGQLATHIIFALE